MITTLTLTRVQHEVLMKHLLPGDGLEAVALLLCGRATGNGRHRLLVAQVVCIPYDECDRRVDRVTWPTDRLVPLLAMASKRGMAIVKIHSHPAGFSEFSSVDDRSDATLFPSVHAAVDDGAPHASAVMLPDGRIFGRAHAADGSEEALAGVNVIGDELWFWPLDASASSTPEFARRHAQAFGKGTFDVMSRLSVAVVGCSGTGSVVIDELARLGIGRLVLVDPDVVEEKNLNRILNTVRSDIGKPKVEVLERFIGRLGLGTKVEAFRSELSDLAALGAVASCDIAVGCMDSIDGRDLLNRIATFYLLPYFDVGVRLDADGLGGIDQICGSVHYIQPGLSSLKSRGVYTSEQVRAAGLRRTDPEGYRDQVERGYIRGIEEDRPAVNAVNMLFSSLLVMEILDRLHQYRLDPSAEYSKQSISLSIGAWLKSKEGEPDLVLARYLGRGDMLPPLDQPFLDKLLQ